MGDLSKQTKEAISWSALERITYQALRFVINIVLARLVDPSEYGLISLILVFVTVAQLVMDGGFSQALIQRRELGRRDVSTVFWVNVCISALLYSFLFALAPTIARSFDEPRLTTLVRVVSLNLVIKSLGISQLSILSRKLRFRQLFVINVPAVILAGTVGIACAAANMQVWSIVIFQIVNVSVVSFSVWAFCDPDSRPRFEFSRESFDSMLSFGSGMFGALVGTTIARCIYDVAIGRFLSFAELGYYSRARAFQRTPSLALVSILNRVLFPVFSVIQDDDRRIVSALRKGIPIAVFAVTPVMFFQAVVAEELVTLLLTPRWLPAVELMHWFPILGVVFPVAAVIQAVVCAKGRSGLFFVTNLLKQCVVVAALFATIKHGVLAIVIGQVVVGSANHFLVNMPLCRCVVPYSYGQQLKDVVPYIFVVVASVFLVSRLVGQIADPMTSLSLKAIVFFSSYWVICSGLRLDGASRFQCQVVEAIRTGRSKLCGREA